jgi:hypothetical protein
MINVIRAVRKPHALNLYGSIAWLLFDRWHDPARNAARGREIGS